jgi:hypothetical protein
MYIALNMRNNNKKKKASTLQTQECVQQFLCSGHSQAQRQIWLQTFLNLMMVTLFEVR